MSTTVDSKVLEMRFDNRHFENNVSTTMSTLDKLKQKLNFTGGTKGLEEVGKAAKNVNMSGLGSAVDTVQAKFSAMQVVGVTALANITNSAVNAGKRMVAALTIDPVKDGFQEYEMTLNAIQTTMAATGKTAKEVEKELEKLDEYADKTVYSTADMLNNLPKFTNAGVELEQATKAMIGIANATALAGGDAGKASIAFYNLGQAIGTGYLTRMDYNSINNAGIATMEWKNQMVEAAIAQGTLTKVGEDAYKAGNKTLTLQQLFIDGLQEQWATTDVMMKVFGDYGDETTEIGKKSYAAAQDIKTFSMMMDSLKATAGTGWKETWQIIFGDLDEAKEMWTGLTNFISNLITKMADFRNAILESALGKGLREMVGGFEKAFDTIANVTAPIKSAISSVKGITKSLEEHNAVVKSVIQGKWGHMEKRWNALTEAGYDWVYVQNKVNEELGNSKRRTSEYTEWLAKQGETTEETTSQTADLGQTEKDRIKTLLSMSEAELKAAGYTQEQIDALKTLAKTADMLGLSIDELLDNMDEIDGRWLLIKGFQNLGNVLTGVGTAIKEAWKDIFPEATMDSIAQAIFNATAAFSRFTASMRLMTTVTDENGKEITVLNENGKKLARTFKGIFAAIDIVLTIVGGPLKIALKLVTQLLGAFGFNILDVTAWLGDGLVKLRDFIDGALDFTGVFEKIANPIKKAYKAFREWIASLKDSENLPRDIALGIASGFGKAFAAIKNFFKSIPGFFSKGFDGLQDSPIGGFLAKIRDGLAIAGQTVVEIGKIILEKINGFLSAKGFKTISADSIAGLVNGFKGGASKVWKAAVDMVSKLVAKVKEFLGIHSPSTVFAAIGGFMVAGLIAGLQNGVPDSLGAVKDLFQPMLDWINGIDFGAVIAGAIGIGAAGTVYKGVDALHNLSEPLAGLGEVFEGTGKVLKKSAGPIAKVVKNTAKVVKSFSNVLDGVAFSIKADAIKSLGQTLLMLVAAVAILTFFDPAELWNAVGIVAALAVILVGLTVAMDKLNSSSASFEDGKLSVKSLSSGLTGIGVAMVMLAITAKMLGTMDPDQLKQGLLGMLTVVGTIGLFLIAFMKIPFGPDDAIIVKNLGKVFKQIATSLLLMTLVIAILGKMKQETLIQGGIAILAFAGIMVGLMAATKLIGANNVDKIGGALLKISVAIGVMALVAKMLGGMDRETLIQGGIAILAFAGIIVGLMAATKLIGGYTVDLIGGALLKMSVAIGVMALVAKMLGGMDREELIQGTLAVAAFGGIIVGLIAATKLVGPDAGKIGTSLLSISGAIAILAFTAFMLSMVSWEGFAKGTTMIIAFSAIIVGLIAATKLVGSDADKIGKTILSVAGAIGILALIAVLLGLVPVENLKRGVIAVSILSVLMAILIASTKNAKDSMGTVIALAALIAVLAVALYKLSGIPANELIGSAIALGGLMLVMAGVLTIIAPIGKKAKEAIQGVIALTSLAVPLALFGLVLAMMSALKVKDALPNVIALSALCAVLTVLLIPLTIVGALIEATGGVIFLGIASLAAIALVLLAFVGTLALMSMVPNCIANAMALATLMAVIGDVLFKLSLVAPLAVIATAAVTAIVGVMTVMGVLATALGALVPQFPQLQTFLDTGLSLLTRLAEGLGQMIGSFISALAGEIMSILPNLGLCLSQFMMNAMPFIMGAKMVDASVLAGAGYLAGAVLALTAADLIAGLMSFLQGGSSFADLGTELSRFMENAKPFIEGASMLDEKMMGGVKALAETVLILTAANVLEGLTSWLTGGNSLGKFAEQLPTLGTALAGFAANIGTFSNAQVATVNCAAQAVKLLASAAAEIPNTGGLLADLIGDNDLETFANQFPKLGTGLSDFLTNVGEFSDDQIKTVNCAAEAVKTLASAANEIPNTGGLLASIVGDNNLDQFAAQFPKLGTGIKDFMGNIGTFTEEEIPTVTCAAEAVKSLASAAKEIPNSGGWVEQIVGSNDLDKFASQFPKVGKGIVDLRKALTGEDDTFDENDAAIVKIAAGVVSTLANVAQQIPEGDWWSKFTGDTETLESFASQFPEVGKAIDNFMSEITSLTSYDMEAMVVAIDVLEMFRQLTNSALTNGITHFEGFADEIVKFTDKMNDFITNLNGLGTNVIYAKQNLDRVLDMVKTISDADSSALATFAKNLKTVGEEAVKKFVGAFTSESAKKDVKAAGTTLGKQAVDGAKVMKTGEDGKGGMYGAGGDLGDGLVSGINSKKQAAYDAGFALGQQAVQGEKDGQKSNSPSKLTIQAGKWIGEGLIIGMGKMGNQVYKSGYTLGETATRTISSSIARISDMVNTDIDAQPTIRPVLDLSDVRSGAATLGDMLNLGSSIGVSTNVRAISSLMAQRGQNGANADVVSAIDKLNKKMDNIQNASYTINGITYDDGSNITDAVRTLVRATQIERRV